MQSRFDNCFTLSCGNKPAINGIAYFIIRQFKRSDTWSAQISDGNIILILILFDKLVVPESPMVSISKPTGERLVSNRPTNTLSIDNNVIINRLSIRN